MIQTGLSIGLLMGSFNPAHKGHKHIALCALNRLHLQQVWWVTSLQNPLKPPQPAYAERVQTISALGLTPRMKISHMERDFGTHYTIDCLKAAQKRWPQHRFVLLIGADNWAQLPKWRQWRAIIELMPIAIIARSQNGRAGTQTRLQRSRPAQQFAHRRLPQSQINSLKDRRPPAWCYLHTPLNRLSSHQLRSNSVSEHAHRA